MAITIALIALAMAVAIPGVNALTGVKLRTGASMLAGLMREAYARAAITGKVHRVVLDLDNRRFWIERTEDRFVLAAEKAEADAEGRGGLSAEDRAKATADGLEARLGGEASAVGEGEVDALALLGITGGGGLSGGASLESLAFDPFAGPGQNNMTSNVSVDADLEEALKKRVRRQAGFSPAEDDTGQGAALEGDVRFLRVWVEHQREAFVGGSSEIYFFPTGYTERAIVVLTDDEHGERVISLDLNPLTARTRIVDEEIEVPR